MKRYESCAAMQNRIEYIMMCNNKIKECIMCMPHEVGARCNPGKAATKAIVLRDLEACWEMAI